MPQIERYAPSPQLAWVVFLKCRKQGAAGVVNWSAANAVNGAAAAGSSCECSGVVITSIITRPLKRRQAVSV
ncbi:hypothetical protein U2F26_34320 [Micromonospora sp. 4G57]|uniref:Uncharacterized protein n=1 Tax=Micromonospora sicca TaxID=2202420 RepID=A0ABU5JP83_9ACTN|nr:hypothetical protein [Micromonospora sp. 4G57]MDZ5447725.1 hypothetical protein [Micromonospora sp. 4G57]MDZ5494428.1 hypothetical protein [Micromonospora sp. 4G53]